MLHWENFWLLNNSSTLKKNDSLYIIFRNILVQINTPYCNAFCSCAEFIKCFLQQFLFSCKNFGIHRKFHVQKQIKCFYTVLERKQLFKTNISPSASIGCNSYFQLYIQTKSKSSECNYAPALTFRKQCLQVCTFLSIRTTLMANQTVLWIMKTLLCTQKRNLKVYILALHNYHKLLSKSVLVRTELKLQQWLSSNTVPRQFGRGG